MQSFELAPMAVHIGAEIRGIDLAKPPSAAVVADLRSALLQWKVLFFRNQSLDHTSHVRAAALFGTPTPGHVLFGSERDHPAVYSIARERTANRNRKQAAQRPWSGWHTDITAAVNPPWASMLRGDVVPPYGGDTQWVNLAAAYANLSPPLQRLVDTLDADHHLALGERRLAARHPLVRVHPETGERVLYVSPGFVRRIDGLKPHESDKLLELLWEQSIRPEFTVRFRWEPGSVALWDNRSTAHLAPADIFDTDFERQFWRVTLLGDVPEGVDGRRGQLLEGEPIGPA